MSAHVQIHCDRDVGEGTCIERTLSRAATVDAARAEASRVGWMLTREGKDICPWHSGRRP